MTFPVTTSPVELAELGEDAKEFIRASRADNTIRAYKLGWDQFTDWCEQHQREALPASPEAVALYITDLAGRCKPATIDLRLASISAAHRAAGIKSPTKAEPVRLVRRGIRRTLGTAQRQVRPVTVRDLQAMVRDLNDGPAGCRDRAILLLGFAGALRCSEVVAVNVGDVTEGEDGLTVHLRRSKTDQEGAGRSVGIPYGSNPTTCPVRAWRRWLEVSGITEGAAFRPVNRHGQVLSNRLTGRAIAELIKRRAAEAGISPDEISGHSLRAGLATAAAKAGVPEWDIARTTGHRSMAVLRGYVREANLFKHNAASAVGL